MRISHQLHDKRLGHVSTHHESLVRFKSVEIVEVCLRHVAHLMGGVLDVGQHLKHKPAESSEQATLGPYPTGHWSQPIPSMIVHEEDVAEYAKYPTTAAPQWKLKKAREILNEHPLNLTDATQWHIRLCQAALCASLLA